MKGLILTIAIFTSISSFATEVSSKCIQEGVNAKNEHIARQLSKNVERLNQEDVKAILEDAEVLARIVARSCAVIEDKNL